MKLVKLLITHEKIILKEAIANHPKNRVQTRAHAIIFSDKGYPIMKLAGVLSA